MNLNPLFLPWAQRIAYGVGQPKPHLLLVLLRHE